MGKHNRLPIDSLPTVTRDTPSEEIVAKMNECGGVIIRRFLTASQLRQINSELEGPLNGMYQGSKHDHELMKEFHGAQTKRLTNLIMHSQTCRGLLDDDLYHGLGEHIYRKESGDWWMTTAQVIDIGPGNRAQPLHRDLGNYPVMVKFGVKGPTVMSNLMIALTRFTKENGATRIIPGSQHWDEDYTTAVGDPSQTIAAEMDAGDALLFSGKALHGGGANVTANERRRGLTMPMQPAYLTPEEAYPFLVTMEVARQLSPRAQRLIGFRSVYPVGSPGLWQNNYEELANHLKL